MPGWMRDWPVLGVFLFFLFGAVARSQAIYWVGRGVTAGVLRSRWGDRLDSSQVRRATTTFERWGMPVVPLAFLTVGFQSAVFASVGLLRVHWLRFTLWTIPGCLVWAALWGASAQPPATRASPLAPQSAAQTRHPGIVQSVNRSQCTRSRPTDANTADWKPTVRKASGTTGMPHRSKVVVARRTWEESSRSPQRERSTPAVTPRPTQ